MSKELKPLSRKQIEEVFVAERPILMQNDGVFELDIQRTVTAIYEALPNQSEEIARLTAEVERLKSETEIAVDIAVGRALKRNFTGYEAEVVRLTKNSADSYCARCGLVIPYVYPLGSCECPECGNTMLPSSENLREIATLKAEVARLREVLSEAEAIAIDHLNLLEAQGWTRHQANEIAITKTMLENIREALATRQEE